MGGFKSVSVIINSNLSLSEKKNTFKCKVRQTCDVDDVTCWRRRCEKARR